MAYQDGSRISIEELKRVLASLQEQRDIINNTYNNSIKRVLESSADCFTVSGLNNEMIIASFDDTFKNLNNNFNGLINVLENNVIKTYTELAAAIRQMFGEQFASKLIDLLGIK